MDQSTHKPEHFFVNAVWMATAAIAIGLFFDYFFYEKALGVGFPLFVILVLGVIVRLSWRLRGEVQFASWELVVPIIFFAVMVFVRENSELTVINVLVCVYLLILLLNSVWYPNIRRLRFLNFILPVLTLPFKWIGSSFLIFLDIVSLRGAGEHRKTLGQALRGTVITLPVIVALILLLSNVDPVIKKVLHDILNFTIEPEIVVRSIEVLLVAGFTLGMLACISVRPNEASREATTPSSRFLRVGHVETTMLLGSINALLAIIILLQISYLFGGEAYFQIQEITYATYAHKGFFELVLIAVICLAVMRGIELFLKDPDERLYGAVNRLSAFLAVELLALMVSAFQRLALYEQAYGFTVTRIFGHTIIIGMGIVLLLFMVKILYRRTSNAFTFHVFETFIVLLALLNVINIEGIIVAQNIQRFENTEKLDTYYLNELSSDAVPAILEAYRDSTGQVRRGLSDGLRERKDRLKRQTTEPWQSIHLSRFFADQQLTPVDFD